MKSFAVFAAVAGVAVAQTLGPCAQLCADNMARIANTQFNCAAGDIACFCGQSNWAYGVRDCSAQACDAEQAAQAVSWAAGQCNGVAQTAQSTPAAVPILTSAVAGASNALASGGASVTGGAQTAITTLPLVATVTDSAGNVATTTTGFSTVYSSLTGSAASDASGVASSLGADLSSLAGSASSAAGSAASSGSGALASATNSLASGASSRAASATNSAGGAPASTGAAPKMTGLPIAAGAGLAALLLL